MSDRQGQLPSKKARIVPAPKLDGLLDANGMATDPKFYMENKSWDIKSIKKKEPVSDKTHGFTFRFLIEWKPSWHSEEMIKYFKKHGWRRNFRRVSTRPKTNKRGYKEYKCTWKDSYEVFPNLSGFFQREVEEKTG